MDPDVLSAVLEGDGPMEPPPEPQAYQQTLKSSFVVGGLGLHSGGYTCIRVGPAYAGDGRYFVRVEPGTNALMETRDYKEIEAESLAAEQVISAAEADHDVDHFLQFLKAQDEGYPKSFQEYSKETWPRDLTMDAIKGDGLTSEEVAEVLEPAELSEEILNPQPINATIELQDVQREGSAASDGEPVTLEAPLGSMHPNYTTEGVEEMQTELNKALWREEDDEGELDELVAKPDNASDYIPAALAFSEQPSPLCTILRNGEERIVSVEHLLAALEACGVDNARIEYELGNEVPVLDGSAYPWCIHIQKVGCRPAPPQGYLAPTRAPIPGFDTPQSNGSAPAAGKKSAAVVDKAFEGAPPGIKVTPIEGAKKGEPQVNLDIDLTAPKDDIDQIEMDAMVPRPVEYKITLRHYLGTSETLTVTGENGAFISYNPESTPRLSVGLDYSSKAAVIGNQWAAFAPLQEEVHFCYCMAPARNYLSSVQDAIQLRDAGFYKGANTGNVLIAEGEEWYDDELVRIENEAAAHRVVDLMGDLSLLAPPGHAGTPIGHIVSFKADHALNSRFLKALSQHLRLMPGVLTNEMATWKEDDGLADAESDADEKAEEQPDAQGSQAAKKQGEFAEVGNYHAVLSSSAATTCIIAAVFSRSEKWSYAALTHLDDQTCTAASVADLCKAGKAGDLHLVGGYEDSKQHSSASCTRLFGLLQDSSFCFNLKTACIGPHNTDEQGAPRCTSLSLNTSTGEVYPGATGLGPEQEMRRARHLLPHEGSAGLTSVFSIETSCIELPQLHVTAPPEYLQWLQWLLQLNDADFLESFSTSPLHEEPNFVREQRDAIRWLLSHKGDVWGPAAYEWDRGQWVKKKQLPCPSRVTE
ncbi:hypothetical protein WJX73_003668 [Symbiochloris irregularis]|uniref:UDP-3-O-acyl-N-acetylglucosamine deacetylase n=1 Tax=Symbiochloris irregularis TaxID=706552 RepID=A0AAW1PGB0_9CHLO